MPFPVKTRIMYIECKGGGYQPSPLGYVESIEGELTGPARIGRVTFNRNGKTIYYDGHSFQRAKGFKSNYICVETGERYWISGPKKRGGDALYATNVPAQIDQDARREYWTEIRGCPERSHEATT
jgi:hypothetical protein